MSTIDLSAVKGIRPTPKGQWEATINHPSLEGGKITRNFPTRDEAAVYKVLRLMELNSGAVLPELKKTPTVSPQLSQVLQDYLDSNTARIAQSDRPEVERLQRSIKISLAQMTTGWVDDWVREMKRKDLVAPGTIRKKVESLARAVEWWWRQKHQDGVMPGNPLRTLPIGYSTYTDADVPKGQEKPVDTSRDRRLGVDEYQRIQAAIQGLPRPDRERPWGKADDRQDFLTLFRLIVATGLRLREAYKLRWVDVKFDLFTIHVRDSKTGAKRDAPMSPQVEAWMRDYREHRTGRDNVFPWWGGSEDEDVLKQLTNRLTHRFKSLFAYCECVDLTEHDLRHEATCRWVEMKGSDGRWMYRTEEVQRITGHKNSAMFQRYLSMRGSDLAERMR